MKEDINGNIELTFEEESNYDEIYNLNMSDDIISQNSK